MHPFFLERRLEEEDPDLHRLLSDCIVVLARMLDSFFDRFPDFTDHSILHSLNVIEFCNRILGQDQVERLSPEECYVLLMSCYMHDLGMGVPGKDLDAFSAQIDFGDYFDHHDPKDEANTVRAFHNEYSALVIEKYADLFEIPSEALTRAIIQVSRGHRKTDLYDEQDYADIPAGDGVIRTAYLAAVLRLADEIDVADSRNPELLFDTSQLTNEQDILAFGTHESISEVAVEDASIILFAKPISAEYALLVEELADKIRDTLDYCRDVAEKRSDHGEDGSGSE